MFQSEYSIVRIALLFILMRTTVGDFTGCNVYELNENKTLTINNCRNYDSENCLLGRNFTDSLEIILRENPLLENVTVTSTLLMDIPESLCNLKHLKQLHLTHNCLSEFPEGCLVQLTSLESITVTNSKIKILTKGLLTGLNKLKTINFSRNEISSIDPLLFSNVSDLKSLKLLHLHENLLKSVDTWPMVRSLSTFDFRVDLSGNKISTITNEINWKFKCNLVNQSALKFEINMRDNEIQHVTDVIEAFFGSIVNMMCLVGKDKHPDVVINIEENTFNCDCKDYNINKHLKYFNRVNFMNSARCFEPQKLRKSRFLSVPLEELICNFTGTSCCIAGCNCIFRPHGKLYEINCADTKSITGLPDSVCPLKNVSNMTNMSYNLNFAGNGIPILEERNYFNRTRILDLSNTRLKSISPNALHSIKNIEVIKLNDNLLETLPKSIMNVTFEAKEISLGGNPWKCDCENAWFKEWLGSMTTKVLNFDSISCVTPWWLVGRVVITVDEREFCEDPAEKQRNQLLLSIFISAMTVVIIVVIVMLLMKRFKVELHSYLNIHPFDRDECTGENLLYDAFISTSYVDRLFGIALVHLLESKGYRVCYHEKDFIVGQTIAQNILQAISNSKRVICYITESFLESTYCMYEFQRSLHQNVQIKRQRLIALIDGSLIISQSSLPHEVYDFLTTHTYIEIKSNKSWNKQLFYSLPVKKLGNQHN